MPPLPRCRRSQRSEFLPWWAACGSCVGNGRLRWSRGSRRLGEGRGTSDEGNAALDDVFCLFVEGEAIAADVGMDSGAVKEALHHSEEGGAGSKAVSVVGQEKRIALEDVGEHNKYLSISLINAQLTYLTYLEIYQLQLPREKICTVGLEWQLIGWESGLEVRK